MKKFALYLSIIAFLTGLVACEGKAWDTDESLKEITYVWSGNYIDYVYNNLAIEKIDTIEYSYKEKMYITTDYKDTLRNVIRFVQSKDEKEDSVDVVSTLVQYGDTVIVTTDGYRYYDELWAHLYTLDPGIINCEGIFHVDFYETGKTTPWAWGEVPYQKTEDSYTRRQFDNIKVGRY